MGIVEYCGVIMYENLELKIKWFFDDLVVKEN